MNYGPIIRIFLRYVIGGVFIGSQAVGDQLAADPDIVAVASIALGAAVEAAYAFAKRNGGRT